LTTLDLRNTHPQGLYGARNWAQRTRVLAEMMKENRVLFTIDLERY
jgi:hypothetical protein